MNKTTLLKLLGAVIVIAIYWLGFATGVYYAEKKAEVASERNVLSDEEIMKLRIMDKYGPEYYGVLRDNNNDEYIDYLVYSEDGTLRYECSTHRAMYQRAYTTE